MVGNEDMLEGAKEKARKDRWMCERKGREMGDEREMKLMRKKRKGGKRYAT